MKLPGANACVVEREKVIDYLLSASHPTGRHKAAFFRSYGFSPDGWRDFADALRHHGAHGEVVEVDRTPFGVKHVVDGDLRTPVTVPVPIRTVWFTDSTGGSPRLVTAYPAQKRGRRG